MWLLLVMLYIMPFETSPYLALADSFLGIIPDFTVIKLLGLFGFIWAALRIASGERFGIFASRQAKLFLLFYAGVILSGILSGSGYLIITKYLAQLLFLPFVLVSIRTHDDLRRVVYALALALIIVFPYAVRQMLRFNSRLGTGLSEPNYFAADLLLVIPLAFVIARQQADPTKRKLWLAGAVILVLSLFMTASRGGFLGLIAAGLIFAYRRRGFGAAVGVLAALALALVAFPSELGTRALATLRGDTTLPPGLEASNRAHTALFWAGLRMIGDAPLTGVGPFNFKALSTQYTGLDVSYMAHNTYLELAAELGLPVLAVFIGILATTFAGLRRATKLPRDRQARELAEWADGLRSGLVGFLVAATFISAQYQKLFWFVVFVSIVVERLAWAHSVEASVEAPAPAGYEPVPEASR